MSIPIPPWWLRLLSNGRPREYAIGAIAFVAGYYLGKGDRNHWKDVARSADRHWHNEHGWGNHHSDNHGKYTHREHERQHRHGGHYER
jgi:hypothetical protein